MRSLGKGSRGFEALGAVWGLEGGGGLLGLPHTTIEEDPSKNTPHRSMKAPPFL